MDIRIRGVVKRFGAVTAVDRADLTVRDGELFTLLGPSGCGKTTLLRLLAGFYQPDAGEIHFGGRVVSGLAPYERNIGMVFQNYALWPHMTVAGNVAYGLKLKKLGRTEVERRLREGLAKVNLAGFDGRYPGQLSGGQQQRVALARALVLNPDILLLDEPLSNLDAKIRVQVRAEIHTLQRELGITTVYVTHDQVEAMTLADRVVVMNHGRIEQIGTPNELYHKPATRFVASFIGSPAMNFIPCRLEDVGGKTHIRLTDRITFPLPPARAARYQNISRTDKLQLGIRPEHLAEARPHVEPGIEPFEVVLDVTEPMGMETLVYFTLEGAQICGRVNPNAGAHDGAPLRLAVDLNNMHLLNEVTGAVL